MKKEKKCQLFVKPNPFYYGFLRTCSKILSHIYGIKLTKNELDGTCGRRVIIANHESAIDFVAPFATIKEEIHAVASRSIIHTLPIANLAERCGIITKNQFQTSLSDLYKMKAVIDHEVPLLIYPAGLMSESGTSTPIPSATGKFIKWLDADVYVAKISGTYMTKPKWAKNTRRGKASFEVYKLIDRQGIAALDDQEAQSLVEEHLYFDAYRNAESANTEYKNGDDVRGLENVLYKCPLCKEDFSIKAKGKSILACTKCSYAVKSDRMGLLHSVCDNDTVFKYPSDWYSYIERSVREEIEKNEDFLLECDAEIQEIDEKRHKYVSVGEARVRLSKSYITLSGKINGAVTERKFKTDMFPSLPFKPGAYFEIQHGGEIFRVLPKQSREVMHWIFVLKATYEQNHSTTVKS